MGLQVYTLPARRDNLIYILRDEHSQTTCAIDPSEAQPVFDFLKHKNWPLSFILNTHHHYDHVDGNLALKNFYSCWIGASEYDIKRVPGCDNGYVDNDHIRFGPYIFQVLAVPGHTLGAVAYYCQTESLLFSGDTFFALGCGRLFEGSPDQMWDSLQKLASLPGATQLLAGHNYLEENLAFALKSCGSDSELNSLWQLLKSDPASAAKRLPTTVSFEKSHNPFLKAQDCAAFSQLRQQKDNFKLEDYASLR